MEKNILPIKDFEKPFTQSISKKQYGLATKIFWYIVTNEDFVFDLTNDFVLFMNDQNLISQMDFCD